MDLNLPDVRDELEQAFRHYVDAINANDIDAVTAAFWDSEHALRYGPGEQLYGKAAIAAFRNTQRGQRVTLEVTRLAIATFGRDFATANCEMRRSDRPGVARMSHTWVKFPEGWRIVAAHVSTATSAAG